MSAGQIQLQLPSPPRPVPSAPLLNRTEPAGSWKAPLQTPGGIRRARRHPHSLPAGGQAPAGPHRAAAGAGRAQGEKSRRLVHRAPLVWCTSYLLTLSVPDIRPGGLDQAPESVGFGVRTMQNSRHGAPALRKGGATARPAPGGPLATSPQEPPALCEFSRESAGQERGARYAFSFFLSVLEL